MGCETDLLAATPFVLVPAFFAAFVGWPSFLEADSPVAALLATTMVYAALSGVSHGLAAMLIYAALSGGFVTHAAMLLWAALSDGYGGDACCDGYSLEFLDGDGRRNLICRLAGLLRLKEALPLLFEWFGPAAVMLTLVGCGRTFGSWCCPRSGSSSQESDSLYELVEVESDLEPEPLRARWWIPRVRTCLTSRRGLA